jgi:phage terminase large subunit
MIESKVPVTVVFQKIHEALDQWIPDPDKPGEMMRRYKYIILTGSSRSSKTQSTIQIIHKYCFQNEKKRVSVWRETKTDCVDTVGFDVGRIFPGLPRFGELVLNMTKNFWKFPGETVFEINGTDDDIKVHGYNGDVAWLNEPYRISRDTFDHIDQRTSDFVIIDWNPKEAHWIEDLVKDQRAIVIHSTFKDNPFCPAEQKRKILSYQPVKMCAIVESKKLTEGEAKQYDLSENISGLSERELKELSRCKENERKGSANAYKWSVYGLGKKAEKPNRIFFWEEISDDEYHLIDAKRYYGVDWGTVDPWGILEAKYYDGALYFHEKNYQSENEIKENCTVQELEEITRMIDPDDVENQGGIVKWMFNRLQIPKDAYIICDTNRPMKVLALHKAGWEYATPAPKPPGSIIDGIDLLSGMKCYYTSSSHNLKYEQENYSRQVDRYGVVLDEPEDTHNHICDPARYIGLFLTLLGVIKR